MCKIHQQNGVAERRIRELSDGTRTPLIHAKDRWPKAISVHLWPFAVNDVFNATRKAHRPASPLEVFSNATVHPRLKHIHPFGCLTYRLNRALQGVKSQPRWEQRAQPVVYLGTSPRHASSVALALDLETAHVSPQFHLKFDDLFETVAKGKANPAAHRSNWQRLCHFTNVAPKGTGDDVPSTLSPHQAAESHHLADVPGWDVPLDPGGGTQDEPQLEQEPDQEGPDAPGDTVTIPDLTDEGTAIKPREKTDTEIRGVIATKG